MSDNEFISKNNVRRSVNPLRRGRAAERRLARLVSGRSGVGKTSRTGLRISGHDALMFRLMDTRCNVLH